MDDEYYFPELQIVEIDLDSRPLRYIPNPEDIFPIEEEKKISWN